MTKLRSRLLVSLVLAAVVLVAVGVDVASAASARGRKSSWVATVPTGRPGAGSFAGEPDPTGQGAPVPVLKPASMTGLPSHWMANLWIMWKMRSQSAQHHSRR